MARDGILQELASLYRTPPTTFENGLEKTYDNRNRGFVQELNNTKVEHGVVCRREGSSIINNANQAHQWYFLQEVEIASTKVLMGLNTKGELWAWLKDWKEVDLRVCKETFMSITDSGVKYDSKGAVSFRRGKQFFTQEIGSEFIIINNFGDAIALRTSGFARIRKMQSPTNRSFSDIQDARDNNGVTADPATNIGLYLDINIAHFKEMDDFFINEDVSRSEVPIIGNVAVAPMNEREKIGKFTETKFLSDYRHCSISSIPNVLTNYGGTLRRGNEGLYWTMNSTSDLIGFALNGDGGSITQTSIPTSRDWTTKRIYGMILHVASVDGSYNTAELEAGTTYFYPVSGAEGFDNTNLPTLATVVPRKGGEPKIFGFMRMEEKPALCLRTGNDAVGNLRKHVFVGSPTPQKRYVLDTASIPFGQADEYSIKQVFSSPSTLYINKFTGTVASAYIDMEVQDDGSLAMPTSYITARPEDISLTESETYQSFDRGFFDTYTYAGEESIGASNIKYDYDTAEFVVKTSETTGEFFYNGNLSVLANNMKNLPRFAVWNNDYIIAKSQQTAGVSGLPVGEQSETQSELSVPAKSYQKLNVPWTDLSYRTLRSYVYRKPIIQEYINSPIAIEWSNDTLYVLQDNNLWTGDDSLVLTDRVQLSFTPYDMVKFYSGVLIFGSDGIYNVAPTSSGKKRLNFFKNKKAKAIVGGNSGAYYVSRDNKIFFVYLVQQPGAAPYVDEKEITPMLYQIEYGVRPQLFFLNDTLHLKTDTEIYGFKNGIWSQHMSFEGEDIDFVSSFHDELVVCMKNRATKDQIFREDA